MRSFRVITKSILFFLVFALLFTGIASIFLTRDSEDFVAKVGKSKIYSREYINTYNQEIGYIQHMLNRSLSEDEIRDFNIKQSVLNKLIERKVISNFAESLQLKTSEEVIRNYTKNLQYFQDANGSFDNRKFKDFLSKMGITEHKYIEGLEKVFSMVILMNCLFGEPGNPYPYNQYSDKLIRDIYKHRYQSRVIDVVKISSRALKNVPSFSDEELKLVYEKDKSSFSYPEYRSLEYLVISPEDVEERVNISEEEINSKIRESELENQRDIINLVFSTEEEAIAAADALKKGTTLEEVALKFLNLNVDNITLRNITKGMLPDNIINEVFSLKEGDCSKILHSIFGWHIIKVKSIHTILPEDLQEVKSRVRTRISREKSSEEVSRIVKIMNDQIDKGLSIQEIADAHNLQIKMIDEVDINGRNRAGAKVKNIPEFENFLAVAFAQQLNKQEHFVSGNAGGFFNIYVKIIEPSRIKNFTESKSDLTKMLSDQYVEESLYKIANDIILKLKSGSAIENKDGIYNINGQVIFRYDVASTENPSQNYPVSLVNELFTIEPGMTTTPIFENKDLITVAILRKINPFDEKYINVLNLKSLDLELSGRLAESLRENLIKHLIKNQPIEINKTFLDNVK